jgi:16S rRNA (guanine527-N7)-methyltransferase
VAGKIRRRLGRAGLDVPPDVLEGLRAYLVELARWNRKINLTSLGLEPLTDDAVDRLIVEPVAASLEIRSNDRMLVDIGSGGGSPGIPLRIAVPALAVVLVESKVRKSAFLREVVRQLGLENVTVENARFEELLPRPDLHEVADVVTLRAVRAEPKLWTGIQAFLKPTGRVFWFGSGREPGKQQSLIMPFAIKYDKVLAKATGSQLTVLERV